MTDSTKQELNRICNTYCRSRIHPTVGYDPDPNCYFKSEGVEALSQLIEKPLKQIRGWALRYPPTSSGKQYMDVDDLLEKIDEVLNGG